MSANKKDKGDGSTYVIRVGEDNLRYAHELLAENEKLRGLLSALQDERLQLVERVTLTDHLLQEHAAMRDVVEALVQEKQRLHDELLRIRRGEEREGLQRQLAEFEVANQRFSLEYLEVEKRNNDLMNLYVASYRLHGTLDRAEVLATIQEIVANLVGCEEHAVFELDSEGRELCLVASTGIDPVAWGRVPMGEGPIGRVAASGETLVMAVAGEAVSQGEAGPALTACIPLKLDGKVTGAIALFRLLPQKPTLAEVDHEMFELLATHAATALYCTRLHADAEARRGR